MNDTQNLKQLFASMPLADRMGCLWLLMDEIAKETGEDVFELLIRVRKRLLWSRYL